MWVSIFSSELRKMKDTPETDQFKVKFTTLCGQKYWLPLDFGIAMEQRKNEALKKIAALEIALSETEKKNKELEECMDQLYGAAAHTLGQSTTPEGVEASRNVVQAILKYINYINKWNQKTTQPKKLESVTQKKIEKNLY